MEGFISTISYTKPVIFCDCSFLNRLIDSLQSLLQNGGQDDPEVIQQV